MTNRHDCGQCEQYRRELEKLRRQNQALRRALRAGRLACALWLQRTGQVLSKTGGVPRGEWAWNTGANEAAAYIAAVLEAE